MAAKNDAEVDKFWRKGKSQSAKTETKTKKKMGGRGPGVPSGTKGTASETAMTASAETV